MQEFAAIDFETTGINAALNRVIEVGIVRFTPNGETISEFESLVNAGRDVGRTDIHGIGATELLDAPIFADVVGHMWEVMNGAVLVAHNKHFDLRFLRRELEIAQIEFGEIDALCTMELMSATFANGPRRLGECCKHLGIEIENEHAALCDARMSARIAMKILSKYGYPAIPQPFSVRGTPPPVKTPLRRREVVPLQTKQGNYLAGLLERLPRSAVTKGRLAVATAQYLNLLDRAIEDRLLTHHESDALHQLASDLGMSADQIRIVHATYLASLCRIAILDGEITPQEERDLEYITRLLDAGDWREILNSATSSSAEMTANTASLVGATVCFTGSMQLPRGRCEAIARQKGLTVRDRVTKDLDVLVVADPSSQSNKATTARAYGTRVMSEVAFFNLIGFTQGVDDVSDPEPKRKLTDGFGGELVIRVANDDDFEDEIDEDMDKELEFEEEQSKHEITQMLDGLTPLQLDEEEIKENLDALADVSTKADERLISPEELTKIARNALINLALHLKSLQNSLHSINENGKFQINWLLELILDQLHSMNSADKERSNGKAFSFLGPYFHFSNLSSLAEAWKRDQAALLPSRFIESERSVDFSDPTVSSLLFGKSIVLTGDFEEFSRSEGEEAIKKRGGKAPSSVSKKTFALVIGSHPGESKFAKAVEYGIPIIEVDKFLRLLESGVLDS